MFDTTDRLYCLVSGDLLDYEVSDRAERRLDYHMQKAQERGELYFINFWKKNINCVLLYIYTAYIIQEIVLHDKSKVFN